MFFVGLMLLLFAADQPASSSRSVEVPEASVALMVPVGAATATALMRVPIPLSKLGSTTSTYFSLTDTTKGSPQPKMVFSVHGYSDVREMRIFYFVADVTAIPTSLFSQSRTAELRRDNLVLSGVSYTVSNRPHSPSESLKLLLPKDWSARSGPLPVTVSTGDSPATKLALVGGFVENSSRTPLPGRAIILCANESEICSSDLSVPANSSKTVYLRYVGPIAPGIYAGQVALNALEYGSQNSPLNVYVSSFAHTLLGIVVVLLGAFLAWWVKTYASNRITRDQALLPVALYHERLVALEAILKRAGAQLGTATPNLSEAAEDWIKQLSPVLLEAQYGLPLKTPSPFTRVCTISSDYTSFLSRSDAAIALLSIFVTNGIERIVELTIAGKIPSPQASKSAAAIDSAYAPDLTPAAAVSLVQNLIDTAQTTKLEASFATPPSSTSSLSLTRMLTEIQRLNVTTWCILLGAASIGTIIAIVLKPGFGRLTDYLLCFVTAFGLPVVGGSIIPSQSSFATITRFSQSVSGSSGSLGM
jgi:hypothetical protein